LIRVNAGRGIDLSESKISSLYIHHGQIAERLNLNSTEATCKFVFEEPNLNELRAIGAGFGFSSKPADAVMGEVPSIKTRIGSDRAQSDSDFCKTPDAQFSVTGGTIRSICLKDFGWMGGNERVPSKISFRGVTVSDAMNVSLRSPTSPTTNDQG